MFVRCQPVAFGWFAVEELSDPFFSLSTAGKPMTDSFKPGDIGQLKSAGSGMTVTQVLEGGSSDGSNPSTKRTVKGLFPFSAAYV